MPSAEADDLVQDVFLRAVEHQKRQTIENPRAFLFAVASNLMIDRIRRAEARGVVVHLPLETVEIEEASPSPLDVLLWEQQAALLRQAVAELDEPMRNALIMHRLDGLTLAEVACALGTTVPVVRGLIAKALAHCSKRLRRPTL
jgi:RNA polymerase sigma-70 factor (ECF subfamily)